MERMPTLTCYKGYQLQCNKEMPMGSVGQHAVEDFFSILHV